MMSICVTRKILGTLIVFVSLTLTNGQGSCTGWTQCNCQFENGQYLDLTPLGNHDGTARFANVSDTHELTYSWNPCFNFTDGAACKDVALCWVKPALPQDVYLSIGYHDTATVIASPDQVLQLVYTTAGHGVTPVRTSYISLMCDSNSTDTFTALGPKKEDSTDFYFELRGQRACPQGQPIPSSTPDPGSKSSTVETVLIVVGVVVICFAVATTLFVMRKKGVICNSETYETLQ